MLLASIAELLLGPDAYYEQVYGAGACYLCAQTPSGPFERSLDRDNRTEVFRERLCNGAGVCANE